MQQVISGDSDRSIRSLQFSSNGNILCAGSFDSTISVYVNIKGEYNHLTKLEGHENEVKCVNWNPSNKKISELLSRQEHLYLVV